MTDHALSFTWWLLAHGYPWRRLRLVWLERMGVWWALLGAVWLGTWAALGWI